MNADQIHAWDLINSTLDLLAAAEEDARRQADLQAQHAAATSQAAEVAVLVSVAKTAATASARGKDTLRPLVEQALAVELPPDLAGSPQVARVRELLGLTGTTKIAAEGRDEDAESVAP